MSSQAGCRTHTQGDRDGRVRGWMAGWRALGPPQLPPAGLPAVKGMQVRGKSRGPPQTGGAPSRVRRSSPSRQQGLLRKPGAEVLSDA